MIKLKRDRCYHTIILHVKYKELCNTAKSQGLHMREFSVEYKSDVCPVKLKTRNDGGVEE